MTISKQHHNLLKILAFFWFSAVCAIISFAPPALASTTTIPEGRIKINSFAPLTLNGQGFISAGELPTQSVSALTIPEDQKYFNYQTEIYTPEFGFNAMGLKLKGDIASEEVVGITVYGYGPAGNKTRLLPLLGDDLKYPLPAGEYATRPIIIADASSFSLAITLQRAPDGTAPVINEIEIIYFDTQQVISPTKISATKFTALENNQTEPLPTSEPTTTDDTNTESAKTSSSDIITRQEWAADESWRLDAAGETLWPVTTQNPEVFVIHHTAGTDGGDDPAATIRAIYYWHAVVLGWGDIGYNYLIDLQGNIYEGRYGGDGAVGGHTFNESANIDYNGGSVGIALLGCFEETPGACYAEYHTTPEMEAALTQLIAAKAVQFKINPDATVEFHGTTTKRMVGHRDLDATYCPGSSVYDNLPILRESATEKYRALKAVPYKAKLNSWSIALPNSGKSGGDADQAQSPEATITPDALHTKEIYSATVAYKNKGTETWTNTNTYLKIYNRTGKKPTGLRNSSWTDSLGKMPLYEASVAPGEIGTFTFLLNAPAKQGQRRLVTRLVVNGFSAKNSRTISVFDFHNPVKGKLVDTAWPIAMLRDTTVEATLTFLNTGDIAWDESTVLTIDGQVVAGVTGTVATNESAQFTFTLTAPPEPPEGDRIKYQVIKLEKKNGKNKPRSFIAGTRNVLITRID